MRNDMELAIFVEIEADVDCFGYGVHRNIARHVQCADKKYIQAARLLSVKYALVGHLGSKHFGMLALDAGGPDFLLRLEAQQ